MAEIKHRGTFILGAREWDLSWYTNGRVDIKDKETQKLHTRWNPTEPYGNLGEIRKVSKTKEQDLEEELLNIMAIYGLSEPFDPVMERLLRDWLNKGHQGLKSFEKFEEMVEKHNSQLRAAAEQANLLKDVDESVILRILKKLEDL